MGRSAVVAVITADIIGSSRYEAGDRRKLDTLLRRSFFEAEKVFPGAFHTQMAFRITAGDEFQCVVSDIPRSLQVLTFVRALAAGGGFRPLVRFRASVGVGEISVSTRKNPYEEDGPAFALARQGLDDLKHRRVPKRWTKLITDIHASDAAADAVLCLADYLIERWTVPQWKAVRWALLGLKREEIGRKLGIAHQNVTKRLHAAGWAHFEVAAEFLVDLLRDASSTRGKVQTGFAPR